MTKGVTGVSDNENVATTIWKGVQILDPVSHNQIQYPIFAMTKLRKKPAPSFHAFLVEPLADFQPKNWQDKPKNYRILEYLGPKQYLGRADAWRFLHNHRALETGELQTWAIYVD